MGKLSDHNMGLKEIAAKSKFNSKKVSSNNKILKMKIKTVLN